MKTIFVVIFLIHWSHQYGIEHGDKSGIYTNVHDFSDGNWRISSNVALKQPRTNIQDSDQIITSELVSENQGLIRKFKYYTSKGTVREETIRHNADLPSFSGKSSYVGDDGIRYIFSYVADSDGYRPKVLFGKNVIIAEDDKAPAHSPVHRKPATTSLTSPPYRPAPATTYRPPAYTRRVGGDCLLNSLIGSGCL